MFMVSLIICIYLLLNLSYYSPTKLFKKDNNANAAIYLSSLNKDDLETV